MTRTRAGLALSILVLSLLLACSSTSETAKSQEPPTPPPLFVGVSPIYPPLAFIDANGEINGVEADFADLMAKQLGRP